MFTAAIFFFYVANSLLLKAELNRSLIDFVTSIRNDEFFAENLNLGKHVINENREDGKKE